MGNTRAVANDIVGVYMLDISLRYGFTDKFETHWRFSFEKLGGAQGWFAWVTKPGQHEICIGRIAEEDLNKKLQEIPTPLTQDDLIDLELWMKSGGLWKEKKIRVRKKKETIE